MYKEISMYFCWIEFHLKIKESLSLCISLSRRFSIAHPTSGQDTLFFVRVSQSEIASDNRRHTKNWQKKIGRRSPTSTNIYQIFPLAAQKACRLVFCTYGLSLGHLPRGASS